MEYLSKFIVYQDDELIGINKPAGLLSIPDGYNPLLSHVIGPLAPYLGRLWIVHRLDRDTSGIMILARKREIHRELCMQFEHRDVKKAYHAVVIGSPDWEILTIDTPLQVNGDRKHRTVVAPMTGKKASTDLRVLRRSSSFTLIEAMPHTGYTHQIRAHLLSIGFPILGDPLYSNTNIDRSITDNIERVISRPALHSQRISFTHPVSRIWISLEAPYPLDFENAIQELQLN
jgi:tRNA pseudouridine32 synthase / 23S rRNA pseudouridine746 synthase